MVAVLLHTLLTPRLMAYGFVVLAPAPLFLAPRTLQNPVGRWIVTLLFAAQGLFRAANYQQSSVAAVYAPFLLTLLFWLWIANEAPAPASATAETQALAA
jgi:hypothetical protein